MLLQALHARSDVEEPQLAQTRLRARSDTAILRNSTIFSDSFSHSAGPRLALSRTICDMGWFGAPRVGGLAERCTISFNSFRSEQMSLCRMPKECDVVSPVQDILSCSALQYLQRPSSCRCQQQHRCRSRRPRKTQQDRVRPGNTATLAFQHRRVLPPVLKTACAHHASQGHPTK